MAKRMFFFFERLSPTSEWMHVFEMATTQYENNYFRVVQMSGQAAIALRNISSFYRTLTITSVSFEWDLFILVSKSMASMAI